MKLAHLCFDGHAIGHTIPIFEHFYPNNNIWFISASLEPSSRIVKLDGENINWIAPWIDESYLKLIQEKCIAEKVDSIILHSLIPYYLDVLKFLFREKKYKVYWVFWGFELYRPLGYSGKMHLIDHDVFYNPISYIQPTKWAHLYWHVLLKHPDVEKRLMEFFDYIDYFCFWLYEDYLLLQKYYPSQIKYKFFQYGANWKGRNDDYLMPGHYFDKEPHTILINHQASTTGNHITLLKKLKSFKGIEDYQLIAPLSYGSRVTRKYISWKGKIYFKNKFKTLIDFMPRDDYFNIIGKAEVALFGQLRQEAAGNIDFLLANGTKVFMREKNTLYQHYKKQGYIVYSFEHDLKSIEDLVGLSLEDKEHNLKVHNDTVNCYEDFMPSLFESL